MRKIIFFSFLLSFTVIQAQNNCSNITRIDLSQIEKSFKNKDKEPSAFLENTERFPINKINGISYLSLLAKVNSSFSSEELVSRKFIIGSGIKQIRTIKVPLNELVNLATINGIDYFEIAGKISPTMDKVLKDIHADSVQKGINLPEAYTGKDVLIGITDWGFDYTHPNFYDTLLTETRIAAAWDQYKQSGPNPAGFSYGAEFSNMTDLLAAQSDTANIYSYSYHGSHVAGITGGSGAGTPYRGVAFEAKYLFTTFLVDGASVLDAYEWMYQKAQAAGKRLVINQSWGLHWIGNLDGTSLLSQAIDSYSDLGVVFVSSAGNNGGVNFHISKTFANDELRSKVLFYSGNVPNKWGQSLSLWGEATKNFAVGIQILNSSNTILAETPMYATNSTPNYIDSMMIIGADTIFFNVSAESANPENLRPHVRFRVRNREVSFKTIMKVTAIDGTVHCWNLAELTTDVGNMGTSFASNANTNIVGGDANYGISEPACTNSTIAVAAYESIGTGTATSGDIASFSSFGPTLDERIKPDISAPGVNVGSSVSSYTDATFTTAQSIVFNGRTYKFTKISGTSMSGPVVTGVVALILDANPYLTANQIKEIIKQTAREDNFTSTIPTEGSVRWGAGKINAYAAIQLALQTNGTLDSDKIKQDKLKVFPNPSSEKLTLEFTENLEGKSISIFDVLGKEIQVVCTNNQIDVSKLIAGVYTLRFESKGKIIQVKFIKN